MLELAIVKNQYVKGDLTDCFDSIMKGTRRVENRRNEFHKIEAFNPGLIFLVTRYSFGSNF